MYTVNISQERIKNAGTVHEYKLTDDIEIKVSSVEEIEAIIGLFGRDCTITITYDKEDK